MLKAHLIDRNTAETIMGMQAHSLSELKERIVTLFKEPNSLLIVVEGMNPFLFADINRIIEEELKMIKLNNVELKGICEFMQRMDKNAEFDLLFEDYVNEEIGYDGVIECLHMSLGNWMEDLTEELNTSDLHAVKLYKKVTEAKGMI